MKRKNPLWDNQIGDYLFCPQRVFQTENIEKTKANNMLYKSSLLGCAWAQGTYSKTKMVKDIASVLQLSVGYEKAKSVIKLAEQTQEFIVQKVLPEYPIAKTTVPFVRVEAINIQTCGTLFYNKNGFALAFLPTRLIKPGGESEPRHLVQIAGVAKIEPKISKVVYSWLQVGSTEPHIQFQTRPANQAIIGLGTDLIKEISESYSNTRYLYTNCTACPHAIQANSGPVSCTYIKYLKENR